MYTVDMPGCSRSLHCICTGALTVEALFAVEGGVWGCCLGSPCDATNSLKERVALMDRNSWRDLACHPTPSCAFEKKLVCIEKGIVLSFSIYYFSSARPCLTAPTNRAFVRQLPPRSLAVPNRDQIVRTVLIVPTMMQELAYLR